MSKIRTGLLVGVSVGVIAIAITQLKGNKLTDNAAFAAEELQATVESLDEFEDPNGFFGYYCLGCHNDYAKTGGMSLEGFDANQPIANRELAEKVIRKLRLGMMPPREMPQPENGMKDAIARYLEEKIDSTARRQEAAGKRSLQERPLQRITREEYENIIGDVFGIEIDAARWLPEDQISGGFDNMADVQVMSPKILNGYLNAASEVARRVIAQVRIPAQSVTYNSPAMQSQHEWEKVDGAPYGTRGGISATHYFPTNGIYEVSLKFMSGQGEPLFYDIDISIDGKRVEYIKYGGGIDYEGTKGFPVESERFYVPAGNHKLAAAFIRNMDGPYEDLLQPNLYSLTGREVSFGVTSPPHITSLTVRGPFGGGSKSISAERKRLFSCRPVSEGGGRACARQIIKRLASQAYGRDVENEELDELIGFYVEGSRGSDGKFNFEAGIRMAVEAALSSPSFLYRAKSAPENIAGNAGDPVNDYALASKLAGFFWGAKPDEELMGLAQSGALSDEATLKKQVLRMINDPRIERGLIKRFAGQWLRLGDLEEKRPDTYIYPNYNRKLKDDMKKETLLFFKHLVLEDRPFLRLLDADYSFMNERLAEHYGIGGVQGESFRRVEYPDKRRKGIFGHGSVLVQTSYGTRTSPVLRGKWVMEVLLGSPPPPPPPNVPDLEETEGVKDGEVLTTRARMEMHRQNPVCASCHNFIDPIGLALDNFDVNGRWRLRENGVPLDTRSMFYDGTEISRPADLSSVLLKRPLPIVRNFVENMLSFAIGRRANAVDRTVVREIVDEAAGENYKMMSLIMGVVLSDPFSEHSLRSVKAQKEVSDESGTTAAQH